MTRRAGVILIVNKGDFYGPDKPRGLSHAWTAIAGEEMPGNSRLVDACPLFGLPKTSVILTASYLYRIIDQPVGTVPQFEIQIAEEQSTHIIRARTPELAIQQVLHVPDSQVVHLADAGTLEGWLTISINGKEVGTIRPVHRMRFRRD